MSLPSSTFAAHDAAGYEQMMGRWSRRLAPLFVHFSGAAGASRVLDLGCGTGVLSQALLDANAAAQVHGVDVSPAYVAEAQRRVGQRATFAEGDACALALPDASFDHVLSLLVLHFVPQPARAIAEMRRVCRPGGTVAAAVWDARGGYVVNRMFFDTAALLDDAADALRQRNFTRPLTRPGQLAQAWRDAGLVDVQDTQLLIRMEFSHFDDWWAPYLGREGPIAEYVQRLDEPGRQRLKDALRAAYLDGEEDGPRSYAAVAWAVRGRVPG
jgi:SAM-dependent methyltransferase